MKTLKLLPCPFYGSEIEMGWRSNSYFKLMCPNKCIQMPRLPNVGFTSRDAAIQAWNTRLYEVKP